MSKPIFSFEAFRDFARSKNPDEEYEYSEPSICACGQYAQSIGTDFHSLMTKSPNFRIFNEIAGRELTNHYSENGSMFKYSTFGTWGALANRLDDYIKYPLPVTSDDYPDFYPLIVEHEYV